MKYNVSSKFKLKNKMDTFYHFMKAFKSVAPFCKLLDFYRIIIIISHFCLLDKYSIKLLTSIQQSFYCFSQQCWTLTTTASSTVTIQLMKHVVTMLPAVDSGGYTVVTEYSLFSVGDWWNGSFAVYFILALVNDVVVSLQQIVDS